jgi:hypothetical protein
MKDLRKNGKLLSLILPALSAFGLIGAIIGFSKAKSGSSLRDILGSMFEVSFGFIFVGSLCFFMYAPVLYDLWDWICHRGRASAFGDSAGAAVMSALSDARAAVCKMKDETSQSSAALNAIFEIKYNKLDEHESKAMVTRIEDFLSQRFSSRDADLCVINESDFLSSLRTAIGDYRVESADRVAKARLSSDVRVQMLKQIDEEFGRIQSDFDLGKNLQLRIVALAKRSLP